MKLLLGDVLSFARHYKGEPFHALLCDAPYHLTSTTERYGKEGAAEATTPVFARAARGFMGKSWDGGDISFQPETWEALGNLLYPGAFGMTFGGSRTAHRMAVAIEDAGMIIHPMIGWVYGSGFPKATRIDTQIDKEAGAEREKTGESDKGIAGGTHRHAGKEDAWGYNKEYDITTPSTELAQSWEGHRYGLQALKPALEPIIVFQKPYEGRPVDSITKTGAGALNIDGGRIGVDKNDPNHRKPSSGYYKEETHLYGAGLSGRLNESLNPKGRWPSNFVLTHSPDCQLIGYRDESYQINRFTDGAKPFGDGAGHEFDSEEIESGTPVWDCVEGCPVKELDRQSGKLGNAYRPNRDRTKKVIPGIFGGDKLGVTYPDSGGASRFFHQSYYVPFYYQAKAGVAQREAGLRFHIPCLKCGGLDSLIHIDEDGEIRECRRCGHPTIKPIALLKHLATLLLPPEEYKPRRLLVPFAGTASEMIGAFQAGWECVIGVEMEKEYVDIGKARLKYWLEQGVQLELL